MFHIRNVDLHQQGYQNYPTHAQAKAECTRRNKVCLDGEWQVFASVEKRPFFIECAVEPKGAPVAPVEIATGEA